MEKKDLLKYMQQLFDRKINSSELEYHWKNYISKYNYDKNLLFEEFIWSEENFNNINEAHRWNRLNIYDTYEYGYHNKKYNVALCLSGHARHLKHNYIKIIKNVIEPLGADVFIHTWSEFGFKKAPTKDKFLTISHSNDEVEIKKCIQLLSPKKYKVENCKNILDADNYNYKDAILISGQATAKNITSQFYSIYQSNLLMQEYSYSHNVKYDIVIKARLDSLINSKICENEIINAIKNKNYIYTPNHYNANHGHPTCRLCMHGDHKGIHHTTDICDIFAFGSEYAMNHYMSAYLYIPKYLNFAKIENDKTLNVYKDKIELDIKDGFRIFWLWKNRYHHMLHAHYPERLLKYHLKNFRCIGSSWKSTLDYERRNCLFK